MSPSCRLRSVAVHSTKRSEGMARFDAIVIGTGQSGPSLARRLTEAGRRVAVIERKRFGGTCVNNGCIPTKTLIASARAAHVARRCPEFGVMIEGPIRVDMKAVKARKDAIVRVSNEGVEEGLRENPGVTVYVGHARFVGPKAGARRRRRSGGRADLHQCRRPGRRPADPRHRDRALPDQLLDDGGRLPARAPRRSSVAATSASSSARCTAASAAR